MDNDLVKQRKQVNLGVDYTSYYTVKSLGCETFELLAEGAALWPLRFLCIQLSDGRLANVEH